jgi:predicted extracellular nuclease
MNGAGAKHGTISWSNIARVTGSGAARAPAGSDTVEVEGTVMSVVAIAPR